MHRILGMFVLFTFSALVGCSASNKRCDSPGGGCGSGHPWFNKQGSGHNIMGNHPWFNRSSQPAGTLPPGAVVGPAVEGVPGGYQPPPLPPGAIYGPTPDAVAPPVTPGSMR